MPVPASTCGDSRRFRSSGKVRLNANGRKLDAWLIYKCESCDRTWNLPLLERAVVGGLDPATGDLFLLNHSPSGVFSPQVDSFGRVIFTRWDHLQRDQQADADAAGSTYGTFNFASEAPGAAAMNSRAEVFPEPRIAAGTVEAYTLNQFFPWQINDDGTGEETLNHIGRHELHRYFNRSFNNDARLLEFNPGSRFNANSVSYTHLTLPTSDLV